LLGLGAAFIAGVGAKCDETKAPADPNQPPPPVDAPKDWPINGARVNGAMISMWVEPDRWPVSIVVTVENHTTGEKINLTGDQWGKAKDVYGPGIWSVPLAYPAGDRVEVHIAAHSVQPSAKGFVAWRDGPRLSRSAQFHGSASAELTVWTER